MIVRDAVALVLADTREQTRLRRSETFQWALGPRVGETNGNNPAIWTGYNLPFMRCTNRYSGDLIYPDLPFNSSGEHLSPSRTHNYNLGEIFLMDVVMS